MTEEERLAAEVQTAKLQAEIFKLKSDDANGCLWALGFLVLSCGLVLVAVAAIAWAWQWGAS